MARAQFINPANGQTYNWPVNHSEEDEAGKERSITRSGKASGLGMIRQQGEDSPLTKRIRGTILHRAQYQQFWAWYRLCETQTIYYKDFEGATYEVIITSFQPRKVRKLTSISKDPSMKQHYYQYSMEMEVVRCISGDEAIGGVTI